MWKDKCAPKALEPMYIFEDNSCLVCGVDRSAVFVGVEVSVGDVP